jgi:hypothetical protein
MYEYITIAQTFPENLTAWTAGGLTVLLGAVGLAEYQPEIKKPIESPRKPQKETTQLRYHPPIRN